jgi:hypothetical protein
MSKKIVARLAVVAVVMAGGMGVAGTASARPNTGPRGCPVENEHGDVSYVGTGTRIGLVRCGSDGDWHFGWLVDR